MLLLVDVVETMILSSLAPEALPSSSSFSKWNDDEAMPLLSFLFRHFFVSPFSIAPNVESCLLVFLERRMRGTLSGDVYLSKSRSYNSFLISRNLVTIDCDSDSDNDCDTDDDSFIHSLKFPESSFGVIGSRVYQMNSVTVTVTPFTVLQWAHARISTSSSSIKLAQLQFPIKSGSFGIPITADRRSGTTYEISKKLGFLPNSTVCQCR